MATELTGYPAFPTYPAGAGTVSPWRVIDTTTKRTRVTLSGDFTVQVEISNAQNRTVPPHLFLPADSDAEIYATASTPDKPVDVPGPIRFLRLRVVSGSVTGGNVEQTSLGEPPATLGDIQRIETVFDTESPTTARSGTIASALAQTMQAREVRIPGTLTLPAAVVISRDTQLTGDQAPTWHELVEDAGGGIRATGKVNELFRVTGRNWRMTGGWYQKVGSFAAKNLRMYGDAVTGADRGIHITAGGGPMSPLVFDTVTFKGFQVAGIHFDMPGGTYPPDANPAIAGQPITTGGYLIPIHNCVFGESGASLKADGLNAIGGLDFVGNTCQGGARIQVATQAMYGSNAIRNNLLQGLNNAVEIGLGLGHIDISHNYFEANTGYLMKVTATRYDSTVRIWGNYNLADGGIIQLVTCRADVDQDRMDVRAANVDFSRLRCREFLPDLQSAPFAFNAFHADVMRDRIRPAFTPVKGGALAGYTIETEAAASTPFGSVPSSSGAGGQYAIINFPTAVSDQLVVTAWVWNESNVSQNVGLLILRNDKNASVLDTGGYMPLGPGEGRVMQVTVPLPAAWPGFAAAFYGQSAGIRFSRPYAAAMPSGQRVPLYVTRA